MSNAHDFDAFYHATRSRLLHQMYAMTGNLADAQDCVQEAYARAWQHWNHVSEHVNPEAWLRTVAWRVAASRWRKIKNGIAAMSRHGPPVNAPEPSPDNVALVSALKEIPEAQRRAIVLHHLVGMSVDEVARETGVASGTVKARLSRGRNALAQLLGEGDAEEPVGEPAGGGGSRATGNAPADAVRQADGRPSFDAGPSVDGSAQAEVGAHAESSAPAADASIPPDNGQEAGTGPQADRSPLGETATEESRNAR